MVNKILASDSHIWIFVPLEKVKLTNFGFCDKRKVVKPQDRVVQLSKDANFCRKITIILNSRDVDQNEINGT